MFIRAKIKSEKNDTAYRVYINDELMTERFYTCPKGYESNETINECWNMLYLEIEDRDDYEVKIENVPGTIKHKVWIEETHWQEKPYENYRDS